MIPEFEIKFKSNSKKIVKITGVDAAANVAKSCFDDGKIEWVEEMIVIALSSANRCLGFYKLSSGGIGGTIIDVRVVLQVALLSNASGIIIAHNHPSGRSKPSKQDFEVSRKINDSCKIMDIRLLDSIIITKNYFYSFELGKSKRYKK